MSSAAPTTKPTGSPPVRILALAGSLRRDSYNRALLEAAVGLAPDGVSVSVHDGLEDIPVFNEDLEGAPHDPPGVVRLRSALRACDGLLVATPEYNQSVPGAVKNVLDWLSRSEPGEDLAGRPVAVIGATTGAWGTRLAQASLRQMLLSCEALVLPRPALYVRNVRELFDRGGELTDAATRTRLHELLVSFAAWIRLVAGELPSAEAC